MRKLADEVKESENHPLYHSTLRPSTDFPHLTMELAVDHYSDQPKQFQQEQEQKLYHPIHLH